MHTSTRLQSTDFQFWQHKREGSIQSDFASFCPTYHELDRVGVVSLRLEDGILHTASALLALTTAFYDAVRTRAIPFFDYPQHFAFVGATAEGVQTGQSSLPFATPKLWDSWSWLDVWPDCKWITAPPTATAMLKSVFDFQINRLFWPRHLSPTADESPVPAYVYKMLRTSLKTIYFYDLAGENQSWPFELEICTTDAAKAIVQESIAQLPKPAELRSYPRPQSGEQYQRVGVADFLAPFE